MPTHSRRGHPWALASLLPLENPPRSPQESLPHRLPSAWSTVPAALSGLTHQPATCQHHAENLPTALGPPWAWLLLHAAQGPGLVSVLFAYVSQVPGRCLARGMKICCPITVCSLGTRATSQPLNTSLSISGGSHGPDTGGLGEEGGLFVLQVSAGTPTHGGSAESICSADVKRSFN